MNFQKNTLSCLRSCERIWSTVCVAQNMYCPRNDLAKNESRAHLRESYGTTTNHSQRCTVQPDINTELLCDHLLVDNVWSFSVFIVRPQPWFHFIRTIIWRWNILCITEEADVCSLAWSTALLWAARPIEDVRGVNKVSLWPKLKMTSRIKTHK